MAASPMRFILSFLPAFLVGRDETPHPRTSSRASQTITEDQAGDICYFKPRIKDTQQRTEFFFTHCRVKAYPSIGGVVIGRFIALKQLGLSNIKPAPRSHDETEEDGLALGMMRQGAHWWPSWQVYVRHCDRLDAQMPYGFHFPPRVYVGYPSSGDGVWVSKFSEDRVGYAENDSAKPYLERIPEDLDAHLNMALNADERCEVLKLFGAKFYDKVEEFTIEGGG
ncbi:hypothetical protein O1611_g6147 [Lasiodiplodia mahajangana]|uniref:Uncharacterized protein n=1 Tax=Lasiodiplodia mahajangana TaxID=1108764 RepID=A0ACC2JIZ6_9PEZI|nr:hypothetical protein O1611_g6147 [Lasiodiplodia mahajangana]